MSRHAKGIFLIVLSVLAFSSAGFHARLIHRDVWTMLFRREWFADLTVLFINVTRDWRETLRAIWAIGWPGHRHQRNVEGDGPAGFVSR